MKFHKQIMAELQAEFLVIQVCCKSISKCSTTLDAGTKYDDLRRHLTDLCLNIGVVWKHGTAVNIIKSADGSVTVALEDGTTVHGNIVSTFISLSYGFISHSHLSRS